MKLKVTSCPLCGAKKGYTILYPQNFSFKDFSVDVFSARRLPDRLHYQLVRCNKDSMVRSTPIADMRVLSKLYTQSKFTYEGEVENLTATYIRALKPVLQLLRKNDLIVEVGCGNGFVLEAILQAGFSKVIGVEPSIHAIHKATKKVQKKILNSIFKRSLFIKNAVSFIFIFQTLDHIPEPDKFLRDCYNVIKPGGYMLSFHHNVESYSARLLGEKSPIFDVEHTQLFSHTTSKQLFENAGFEVLSNISPISTVSLKHLCWLFPFPKIIKERLLLRENWFTRILTTLTIPIPLGNTCIIGKKPV